MTLTCCCGATLDIRDDWATPHVEERFYNAHADCLRKTEDDAFWLKRYAGLAMQGILVADTQSLLYPYQIVQQSIDCAKALLEEVKNYENSNN